MQAALRHYIHFPNSVKVNTERRSDLDRIWKMNHNSWGMTAHGYYLDDDGHVAYDEIPFNYLNLELYLGELKGRQRFMKALSNFVESEIDIALLLRAYDIIMKEADISELANIYTDEGPELAGLK